MNGFNQFFNALSIRNKMLLTNGIFILLILVISANAVVNILSLKKEVDALNTSYLPSTQTMGDINDLYWMRRIRLLLFTQMPTQDPQHDTLKADILKYDEDYTNTVASYKKLLKDKTETEAYNGLVAFSNRDSETLKHLLEQIDSGESEAALQTQLTEARTLFDEADGHFDAILSYLETAVNENYAHAQKAFWIESLIFVVMNLGVISAMIILSFVISGRLSKPIRQIGAAVKEIANGDLTQHVDVGDLKDELGDLASDMNHMVRNLREVVSEIQASASAVTRSAQELNETSGSMTQSADHLTELSNNASAVTEQLDANVKTVAVAVEESSASVKDVYQASNQIEQTNQRVVHAAEGISSDIRNVVYSSESLSASVNTVAAAIEEMSASLSQVSQNATHAAQVSVDAETKADATHKTMDALGRSAKEIGNVVDVIKSIASQTNLLALNATIEAASAGEVGKGFAVVANEVKELARQSANATEDIRAKIEEIQAQTAAAVDAIQAISATIGEMNQINTSIAASVQEQTTTVNEISQSVGGAARSATEVSQTVQKTAQSTEEVVTQIETANKNMQLITQRLEEVTKGTNEISKNSSQAAYATNEMAKSVVQVRQSASETAAGANQVGAAAGTLSTLATKLDAAVRRFRM